MLLFKYIRYKNILSFGDNWTHIQLDRHKTTLIQGKNGGGKCLDPSTIIEVRILDSNLNDLFEKFLQNR